MWTYSFMVSIQISSYRFISTVSPLFTSCKSQDSTKEAEPEPVGWIPVCVCVERERYFKEVASMIVETG